MVFDRNAGKGVKKRYIGTPNPRKVEIPRTSTIKELLEKGLEMYFDSDDLSLDDVQLADSDGIAIELADPGKCTLANYFQRNDYKPSKHKMYIMLHEKVCTTMYN